MLDTYVDRIRAFAVLIFFHYIGYITFRVFEYLEYPRLVRLCYGLENIMARQQPDDKVPAPPAASPALGLTEIKIEVKKEDGQAKPAAEAAPAESHFKTKDKLLTKVIQQHYFRNNLFFFVGIFCAIIGGSKDHCIIISYLILLTKLGEVAGMFFGFLSASYISHALGELANYVNIFTAIIYFVREG